MGVTSGASIAVGACSPGAVCCCAITGETSADTISAAASATGALRALSGRLSASGT
jgi:hypothetical protein